VTTALRERLERLQRTADFDEALYEKLKAIATDCRKHMKEPHLSIEHGDLLYDERGLPR
jgi:antitoxin VapB